MPGSRERGEPEQGAAPFSVGTDGSPGTDTGWSASRQGCPQPEHRLRGRGAFLPVSRARVCPQAQPIKQAIALSLSSSPVTTNSRAICWTLTGSHPLLTIGPALRPWGALAEGSSCQRVQDDNPEHFPGWGWVLFYSNPFILLSPFLKLIF